MRRFLFITGAVLIFTACSVKNSPSEAPIPERIASPMPTLTPVMESTQVNSTESLVRPTDPRELMLNSHQYWQSLFVDALLMDYAGGSAPDPLQTTRTQIWIRQPDQALVISGAADGVPTYIWVSDGTYYQENGSTLGELPDFTEFNFNPSWQDDSVEPHPFGSLLGTTLKDYIFSTSMAQRTGEYRLVGKDTIANRDAYIVEYFRYADGIVIDRLWVDTETGIILRYINFGKPAGGPPSIEMVITDLRYNLEIAPEKFTLFQQLPANFAASP